MLARAVMGLGRHPQNDIVLDDRSLSRFHARVERRGDRFVVVDCGAQNGVQLNGERIVGESSLAPGDRITLGRYIAVFDSANGASRSTPASPAAQPEGDAQGKGAKAMDGKLEIDDVDVDFGDEKGDLTKRAKPQRDPGKKAEPTLVLLFNGMEVSRHVLGAGGLTVGRSKASDVVISLLGLSRKHARIAKAKEGILVEDLGSQNGTWVNNQRITKARKLKHGDLLNFYDYAVLFLEDGDVEVGFPGAGFSPSQELGGDDLSQKETNRSSPPITGPHRSARAGTRSPIPIADSSGGPPIGGRAAAKDPSASELVDLGEGSFLGDEFEEEAAGGKPTASSVLDEDPLDDLDDLELDLDGAPGGGGTDIVDEFALAADRKENSLAELDAAFAEAGAFDGLAGTEGEAAKFDDKTNASVGEGGRGWPRDEELLKALSNSPDAIIITVEVMLAGKAYTQMPLSQTVTRVGTDARCELSLPKSSGLMPWHLTLLHLGSAVVLYRAGRSGKIMLAEADVDMAILRDGDLLDLGKVRLKVRAK